MYVYVVYKSFSDGAAVFAGAWTDHEEAKAWCGTRQDVKIEQVALVGSVEDTVKDATLRNVAVAAKLFAPDLMKELAERWAYSKLTPDERLERMVELLLLRNTEPA